MINPRVPIKRARKKESNRESRVMSNRQVTESRVLSDEERVDLFRRSFFQSSLPDLPKIPGYHSFWATTTNPRDPVHGRLQIGYEFLTPDDAAGYGFETITQKTGDYANCIMVNEMIAMKLPSHLYEAYMRFSHHEEPHRQEEAIYSESMGASEQAAQAARRGGKLKGPVIETGTEELGTAREPPNFADADEMGA